MSSKEIGALLLCLTILCIGNVHIGDAIPSKKAAKYFPNTGTNIWSQLANLGNTHSELFPPIVKPHKHKSKHNTNYWTEWFHEFEDHHQFDFDPEHAKKYANAAGGYETDEVCVYDLRMQYVLGSPDGVLKRMTSFNGQFPGPALTCTTGKTMIVRVTNDIEDENTPTSIHWHGIEQKLSPYYDGPQAISQCPIARTTSMIYRFQLFQSGTYWYHSHHASQYTDGAWGPFIIKNSPRDIWQDSYHDERVITFGDWIHRQSEDVAHVYLKTAIFPESNSSLINGRGRFNCSLAEPGQVCNPKLQGPAVVNVTRGYTYRFRLISHSGAYSYNFSIDGHKMRVIETDGVDTVKGPPVDVVFVVPGQRYSVLITMNQPLDEYWIRTVGEAPEVTAGYYGKAILRYEGNPEGNMQEKHFLSDDDTADKAAVSSRSHAHDVPWDNIIKAGGLPIPPIESLQRFFQKTLAPYSPDEQIQRDAEHAQLLSTVTFPTTEALDPSVATLHDDFDSPPFHFGDDGSSGSAPAHYDRLVVLNATECPIPGQPARMCMNGEPFVPPSYYTLPLLFQVTHGMNLSSSARPIYTPNHNEVVRIVINGFFNSPHPWHLHGHTFWVLGSGELNAGPFVESRDGPKLRLTGPRRDTTSTEQKSWVVLHYVTDNPGTWFLHCHIDWHLEAGLGVTFVESPEIAQKVYKFPPTTSHQACKNYGVSIRG